MTQRFLLLNSRLSGIFFVWFSLLLVCLVLIYVPKLNQVRIDVPIFQPRTCRPNFNFAYLKTHKTGSTSLSHILRRIALLHNLTVTNPSTRKVDANYCYPREFVIKDCIDHPAFRQRNITGIYHARYNEEFASTAVPGATWITILREPVSWAQSFYEFFWLKEVTKIDFPEFSKNVSRHIKKLETSTWHFRKNFNHLMEYDLGYNITQQLPTAEKVIHFMEKRFDLVLITEMFDESLVMLKEYSCLEMSNFTYLAHNQKESRDKKDYKDFRNKRLQQGINETFAVYTAVYYYFKDKLVQKFNSGNLEEHTSNLMKLRQLNNLMTDTCGILNKTSNSTQYVTSRGRLRYDVSSSDSWDCSLHKMSHEQAYEILRNSTRGLIKHGSYKKT